MFDKGQESMKRIFVFCHGFGFDSSFWNDLRPYFSKEESIYLDLGYFGEYSNRQVDPCVHAYSNALKNWNSSLAKVSCSNAEPFLGVRLQESLYGINSSVCLGIPAACSDIEWIGIGHSIGFLKLVQSPIPFKALVGLQAFTNFFGYNRRIQQRRRFEYELFLKQLHESPQNTLRRFYKICGLVLDEKRLEYLDSQRLHDDCRLLDAKEERIFCKQIRILGSWDDSIVSPELIMDNFFNRSGVTISMTDEARHALGVKQVQWVYSEIKRFLGGVE
jgi:pimeloyl-[acyl-carrier protein] methyl ester esterase